MSEPTGPIPSASEGSPAEPARRRRRDPFTETHPAAAPPEEYTPPTQSQYQSQEQHQPQYQAPTQPQEQAKFRQVFLEKSPQQLEGEKLSKTSTVFGVVSFFFAGIILGPLAIMKAAKAEKLGVDATYGKVTGWLGTIIAALSIVAVIFYFLVAGAVLTSVASKSINSSGESSSMVKTAGDAAKQIK